MKHLALFSPTASQPADLGTMVAAQLQQAMQGLGTDEEAIFAALTGRTEAEREAIRLAYKTLTNRELESDLRDELSGTELEEALRLFQQGYLAPEDEIYLAIAGLGTDEERIERVLRRLSGDAAGLQSLEQNYETKYGDLVQDLRGDLSAEEFEHIRPYLAPTILDADVEDCSPANRRVVRQAHATGMEMLRNAVARSALVGDPDVQAAALTHFNIALPPITDDERIAWARARIAMQSMLRADTEATYECEPEQSVFHGLCASGVVAVSLFNIHLCPTWWARYGPEEQAGILVHEWGHKFGTGVNRVFETYCHETADYAALSAKDRIQQPDAYSGFARELFAGITMPCIT
jgi:hypothetical protein